MTEEKPKDDPLIPIMVEVVKELAKHEIKEAMKSGALPIEIGMDENFYAGVCFGIAIASEKFSSASRERKAQEQVKKN